MFTYDSWSHLIGPGNHAVHRTAEWPGYSDLNDTGNNLDDRSVALKESQEIKMCWAFKHNRERVKAHHSPAHPSCPRSHSYGHTPRSQGCIVGCHIETHFQSRALALQVTIKGN